MIHSTSIHSDVIREAEILKIQVTIKNKGLRKGITGRIFFIEF